MTTIEFPGLRRRFTSRSARWRRCPRPCECQDVAGRVHITIENEPGRRYRASVMHIEVRRGFATIEEAKVAAERAARQVFTRVLAALDEGE